MMSGSWTRRTVRSGILVATAAVISLLCSEQERIVVAFVAPSTVFRKAANKRRIRLSFPTKTILHSSSLSRRRPETSDWKLFATNLYTNKDEDGKGEDRCEDEQQQLSSLSLLPSSRRGVLSSICAGATVLFLPLLSTDTTTAQARGLVQFPCTTPLANTYHFLRAGTSLLEEQGMWSTNPLFLTNRDDALSPAGQMQVLEACQQLLATPPTVVRYSFAAKCADTVNIVAQELKLGNERLDPEFFFLDPRAIGAWDNADASMTIPAVFALDHDEAGVYGEQGRPPANEDGTPHETLKDPSIRLRQLLSSLETQYTGDTVLLIFPDGTGPALLSAMIAGIPFNRVHELEFAPGEVRLDVTLESTMDLWKTKQQQNGEIYGQILAQGRKNLKQLRSDDNVVVNLKDQRIEAERIAMEQEMESVKEQKRRVLLQDEEDRRAMMQQEQQQQASVQSRNIGNKNNDGAVPMAQLAAGFAVGVAGVVAAMVATNNNRDDDPNRVGPVVGTNTTTAALTTSSTLSFKQESDDNATSTNLSSSKSPNSDNGGAVEPYASLSSSTLTTNPDVSRGNETGRTATAVVTEVDRKEAAEQAMQTYLEKDDGGSDFLRSLTEIISEETSDVMLQEKEDGEFECNKSSLSGDADANDNTSFQ